MTIAGLGHDKLSIGSMSNVRKLGIVVEKAIVVPTKYLANVVHVSRQLPLEEVSLSLRILMIDMGSRNRPVYVKFLRILISVARHLTAGNVLFTAQQLLTSSDHI